MRVSLKFIDERGDDSLSYLEKKPKQYFVFTEIIAMFAQVPPNQQGSDEF